MSKLNNSYFKAILTTAIFLFLLAAQFADHSTGARSTDIRQMSAQQIRDNLLHPLALLDPNDFRISTMGIEPPDSAAAQYEAITPVVTYNPDNDEFLVVWSAEDENGLSLSGKYEIYGQRVSASTGVLVGGRVRLTQTGSNSNITADGTTPSVVYNTVNDKYLLVWVANPSGLDSEVYATTISSDLLTIGDPTQISSAGTAGDTTYLIGGVSIAYNTDRNEALVVFSAVDDHDTLSARENQIYGRVISGEAATAVSAAFRISSIGPEGDINYGADFPSVLYNPVAARYVVVYSGDDGGDNEYEIYAKQVNASTYALIEADDLRISSMGPEGDASYQAFWPSIAYDVANNEMTVVWSSKNTNNYREVFGQKLQILSGLLTEVGTDDFPISVLPSGASGYDAVVPQIVYWRYGGDAQYLVLWLEDETLADLNTATRVYGQLLAAGSLLKVGDNFPISDIPDGNRTAKYIGVGAASSVARTALITWSTDHAHDDEEYEIHGQLYQFEVAIPTPTPSYTVTATASATVTNHPTSTNTPNHTSTITYTTTATVTEVPTLSSTYVPTVFITPTPFPTSTIPPTVTPTSSPSPLPTTTHTFTPSRTPTVVPTTPPTRTIAAMRPPNVRIEEARGVGSDVVIVGCSEYAPLPERFVWRVRVAIDPPRGSTSRFERVAISRIHHLTFPTLLDNTGIIASCDLIDIGFPQRVIARSSDIGILKR